MVSGRKAILMMPLTTGVDVPHHAEQFHLEVVASALKTQERNWSGGVKWVSRILRTKWRNKNSR
jgi:hypothetical protein